MPHLPLKISKALASTCLLCMLFPSPGSAQQKYPLNQDAPAHVNNANATRNMSPFRVPTPATRPVQATVEPGRIWTPPSSSVVNQDAMPTKVDSSVPAGKLLGVQEARTKFSNSFANAYDGIGNSAPPVANNPAVRNNASQGIRVADNSFPATSFRGGNTFPANPPQPNLNVRLPANGNSSVDGSWSTVEGSFGNLESIQDTASSKMVVGAGSDSTTIWWKEQVLSPMHGTNGQQKVDTNTLVYQTLQRSPRIRALSQDPLIRELQVIEADSDFDPVSFIRSQFQDRNDPVGDQLSVTADGSDFLQDHIWTADLGVRKKLRTGASYELNQTLGFKNSNSNFFVPQDQGTATLALNVTQPLLRGRGRYYNQSQILIAQSAGGVAWNTFIGELQDEIQKTVDAYWQLYTDRCVYLQKQRNVARGETILGLLEGRAGLDSLPSQIARARSAVQSRRTDLANALRDVRNSETEIRRLTADRNWQANRDIELLPIEFPSNNQFALELEQVVFTALNHRPEIKQTMTRAKIAGIQKDISVNELLPELSLLLGTYVSALKGESNLGQAIQDQFGEVTPGYSVGFEFELPIRNRAARSRLSQRKLQLAKIKAEVDETMQNVVAESQVSLRRVTSARETLDSALPAIEAARADLDQNIRRWESFALIEGDLADGQTPTTVLDQLLDSQERLTAAELVYTQSELELKTAEIALQRAMGTLLMHQSVTFQSGYDADVPTLQINQGR